MCIIYLRFILDDRTLEWLKKHALMLVAKVNCTHWNIYQDQRIQHYVLEMHASQVAWETFMASDSGREYTRDQKAWGLGEPVQVFGLVQEWYHVRRPDGTYINTCEPVTRPPDSDKGESFDGYGSGSEFGF